MSRRRRKKQVEQTTTAPAAKETGAPTNKAGAPANKAKKSSAPRKDRGLLLSILLVVIGLHGAFSAYVIWATMKADYVQYQSWVLPMLVLVSLGVIAAAVAMWFWKKWGFYLYAATQIVATAISLMMTGSIWVVFYQILPVVILAYVIQYQHKLKYFE